MADLGVPPGRLIILSGPSGAGKSTVVRELMTNCPLPLQLSVSFTTRPQRPNEQDGRDYHFVSSEKFQQMRAAGDFLECKEVFGRGDWYGSPAQHVAEGLQAGRWMILEIDVQGALSVMQKCPDTISFFIHPGSIEELAIRLKRRGTDSPQAIERRLEVAAEELRALPRYQHEIINYEVVLAASQICNILQTYR